MRLIATAILALSSTALAAAANPVTVPTKLDAAWQAKTRAMYETVVEIPTVAGRNEVPRLAEYIADQLKTAGIPADDIKILPYQGNKGDKTVNLIARWRAEGTPSKKPILLMAHMDVVEAKRSDWQNDPFEFIEKDGYFYGRGTNDNKAGLTGILASVLKLKQAGFKPDRDLIIFFSGDEEVGGNGARLGSTEWRAVHRRRICAELGRRRRRFPQEWPAAWAMRCRRPRRPSRPISSPCAIAAGTAAGRAPTTPSTSSRTASRSSRRTASRRCRTKPAALISPRAPSRKAIARSARRSANGLPTRTTARPPTRSRMMRWRRA